MVKTTSASDYEAEFKRIEAVYTGAAFPTENPGFEILSTIRYDPRITLHQPTSVANISTKNFFLFPEHCSRLQYTLKFFALQYKHELDFDVDAEFLANQLKRAIELSGRPVSSPYKMRLLMTLDGNVRVEVHETADTDNLFRALQVAESQYHNVDVDTEAGFDFSPPLTDLVSSIYQSPQPWDETSDVWDVYIDTQPTYISPFTSFKTTNRQHYTDARNRRLPGVRPGREEVLVYNHQNDVMEGSITNFAVRRKSDGKWITPQLSSGCLCGVMRHFLLRKNFMEEEVITLGSLTLGTEVMLFNGVMGVVKGIICR